MTEAEFRATVLSNPVNAAIIERMPQLGEAQLYLVAGCLFQGVWNVRSGRPAGQGIRDYDLFYWDADTSYEAEDAVIRRAETLFADLGVLIEVRNQARVHLWFGEKYGLPRPAIGSSQESIAQFLVECTCLGISASGEVYAPHGFGDLASGILRPNPLNLTPALYAAKVADYRARWPWLRLAE
ncbi:nucleotidyltransferase family protein [Deinococcus rubellus]|uniref:Nucleotidyltransferase family protein n=1 Tax=Deinococcus rubellus TaxID=1889240 RepID=A0ABY5YJV2_9DEIO|nr:nucleotidyltransferase family protein [Deinococcus rubellus]UWX65390.1 nucleotidyltransferase family protein [Deinococcus rubellus]